MKKRIRIGLRKTGVCLLTAVLVLSAPVAAFASEPAGDEGIVSEQTFGDDGYDFGEIPEVGAGLGTGAETGEGIDGDIQTEAEVAVRFRNRLRGRGRKLFVRKSGFRFGDSGG